MISAKAVMMNNKKTLGLAKTAALPTAVQLFGAEEDAIAYAAEFFSQGGLPTGEVAAIDLNMGCPMHKIVSNGEGSALLKDLKRAEKVISAAVNASKLPVTVKIRAGWDKNSINAEEAARVAEAAGAVAITLHARTKEQLYTGYADHSVTERVVRAVSIPVIGNGDIKSAEDVKRLADMGCAAFMIGRGAVGDPWIFARIKAALEGREFAEPTVFERVSLAIKHLSMAVEDKGEHIAVPEARKHLAAYVSGFPGAAAARAEINTLSKAEDITALLLRVAQEAE
jgi:tRNA-dihydrouridine synthase B